MTIALLPEEYIPFCTIIGVLFAEKFPIFKSYYTFAGHFGK